MTLIDPDKNHQWMLNIVGESLMRRRRFIVSQNISLQGFPGGTVVENLPANAGDTGLSPGLGRSHMPRSN